LNFIHSLLPVEFDHREETKEVWDLFVEEGRVDDAFDGVYKEFQGRADK